MGILHDGIDANLAQGHPVTTVGYVTLGSSGTISSISASTSDHYDFAFANYSSACGDSGGIVVSTRTGNNYIAGIHTGTYGSYRCFTKAININNTFSLTFNGLN